MRHISRKAAGRAIVALMFTAMVPGVAAQPTPLDVPLEHQVPSGVALRLLRAELASQPLAEWSAAAQVELWELSELAEREAAYVRRSSALSWIVPGLGQFQNGDPGAGTLFLLSDLLVGAATAVAAGALLPAPVRPDNLPYLNATFRQSDEAWQLVTPAELIPTISTLVIGGAIGIVLRAAAADHAARLALQKLTPGGSAY